MQLTRYLVPIPKMRTESWGLLGFKDRAYQVECDPNEKVGSIRENVAADEEGEMSIEIEFLQHFTNSSTLYKEPNDSIRLPHCS